MSLTYPEDRADPITEENFIPVYARRGKAKRSTVSRRAVSADGAVITRRPTKARKGVKTWMILAPIGVIAVGGAAALMFMGGGDEAVAPALEPAATAPVLPATPALDTAAAPLTSAAAPAPVVATPAPTPAPASVARESVPVRRAAPAPARRAAPTVAPAAVAEAAPAEPTGPRAYSASPSTTSTLNTAPAAPAPAATPAPTTPRPPAITTQPLG